MSALSPVPSHAVKAKRLLHRVGLANFLVRHINDRENPNVTITFKTCDIWAEADVYSKCIIVDYPANSGRAQKRFHVFQDLPAILGQTLTTTQLQAIDDCIAMK